MFFLPPPVPMIQAQPVIQVQPAPQTQYLGESAIFSVVLKSPGKAAFQWRRNGVVIPGATAFLYVTPPLTAADDNESIDVVVTDGANSVASKSANVRVGPLKTSYTSSTGVTLPLYAWPGKKVVYLTQSNELSPSIMRNLLATTDELWDYYASAIGRLPDLNQTRDGLAVFAQTDKGCGAGCTPAGVAQVELTYAEMRSLYTAQSQGAFDETLFTAFNRAFAFYREQLAYKPPDSDACITAGIAVLLRERALLELATHGSSIDPGKNVMNKGSTAKPRIVAYAEQPALNWTNTFRINVFRPAPGAGCSDLAASLLDSLIARFGGESFLHSFLREAGKRPAAKSTQDAVDNFVLAATAAAQADLAPQFKMEWRWPVSKAAEDESRKLWAPPPPKAATSR